MPSIAAYLLAVVVFFVQISAVQAENSTFSQLGLRLGGMIVGSLDWRLERCGDAEGANSILAAVADAPGKSAEEIAAILEGIDLGARRAAEAGRRERSHI